jgi:hypothetical protein
MRRTARPAIQQDGRGQEQQTGESHPRPEAGATDHRPGERARLASTRLETSSKFTRESSS